MYNEAKLNFTGNIDNFLSTGYNSVFATMAGAVGQSKAVHLINFCADRQVSAFNPPQRKYANRWHQFEK